MLTFLYSITLYPLELAYRHVYVLLADLAGNYGTALLCLSLLSTVIFSPLKKLAGSMQKREALVQQVMAPQLALIKEQSRGAERQDRISALYKRYAYHPLLALRSSVGVLVQVPFLCAAYYMLSSFEPIRGQSCWSIADLSRPDALLWGVNLLPLLMTCFNIGAIYTTPGFARRDHCQAVLVAALFLLLLYHAPSALLIYWTCNNALMLLGNLWPRLIPARLHAALRGNSLFRQETVAVQYNLIREQLDPRGFLRFMARAGLVLAYVFLVVWLCGYGNPFYEALPVKAGFPAVLLSCLPGLLASVLLLAPACAAFFRIRKAGLPLALQAAGYVLLAAVIGYLAYRVGRLLQHNDLDEFVKLHARLYVAIFTGLAATGLVHAYCAGIHTALSKYLHVPEERTLFFLAVLALGLIGTVLSPSALYLSSPDFFHMPFSGFLAGLMPFLFLWILACTVLRLLMPHPLRAYATFLLLVATVVALVYSTVLTGDYGAMDATVLAKAENLYVHSDTFYDMAVVLLAFTLLAAVAYFGQGRKLVLVLQATVLLLVAGGATIALRDHKDHTASDPWAAMFADNKFFALSRNEQNVLVIFLDMFTGGHIEDIFAEQPDLQKRFTGFAWYPDTLAVGYATSFSAPSIYGGPDFTPDRMDLRPELTLLQKYSEAFAALPRNFGDRGYDVSFLHPPYPVDKGTFALHSGGHPVYTVDKPAFNSVLPLWRRKIGMTEGAASRPSSFNGLVLSVSLFKAVPHSIRRFVYNCGQWLPGVMPEVHSSGMQDSLYESAALGLLPELMRTTSEKPTLKFIYSMLPHLPWHLPQNSLIPVEDPYPATQGQEVRVNGVIPEHVYSERHILELLAAFFDWMKQEGVYDNTRIILHSDHCRADSRMLNAALGIDERGTQYELLEATAYPGRPHALLMVKDFNDTGPFRSRPELMSTMDIPALVCEAVGGCPGIVPPDTGPDRERPHYFDSHWRQIEVEGRRVYDPMKTAIVRGSMFIKENWSVPR